MYNFRCDLHCEHLYKVVNKITAEEYYLIGNAVVQKDKDSEVVVNHHSYPEYQHGVLLFSIKHKIPVLVPYTVFEDIYLSEETDEEEPVWVISEVSPESDSDWTSMLLYSGAEEEVQYHQEWEAEISEEMPAEVNALYVEKDRPADGEVIMLLNISYDTSLGITEPKVLYSTLDDEGVILQPAFMPVREFFRKYCRVRRS